MLVSCFLWNGKIKFQTSSQAVAVITGAASGIGFALARCCFEKNMHVVLADRDKLLLQDRLAHWEGLSATSPRVFGLFCDVTQEESLKRLAEQTFTLFNRVDWLFNNAGICHSPQPIWALETKVIENVIDVNVLGTLHGIRAFLPFIFKQKNPAHIINMASIYGLCSGSYVGAYSLSKHAVLALTEALYFDLKQQGLAIDLSVVCPSFVNTSLLDKEFSLQQNKIQQKMRDWMRFSASPEDLAHYIIREVEKKTFYILPHKEIKPMFEQRVQAIIEESEPALHNIEKMMQSLAKRARQTTEEENV